MEPEDPLLADAIGSLAAAMYNFDQARPLMARMHTNEAFDKIREYAREKSDSTGSEEYEENEDAE